MFEYIEQRIQESNQTFLLITLNIFLLFQVAATGFESTTTNYIFTASKINLKASLRICEDLVLWWFNLDYWKKVVHVLSK